MGLSHRQKRRQRRAIAAFVALWGVWLHALLPPGFMPSAATAGTPGLVICSTGLPTHLADVLEGEAGDVAQDHLDERCVFAAAAALEAGTEATPAPYTPVALAAPAVARVAAPETVAGPPVGARAPPVA